MFCVASDLNMWRVCATRSTWSMPSACGFELFAFVAWSVEHRQTQDAVFQSAPCGLIYSLINSISG